MNRISISDEQRDALDAHGRAEGVSPAPWVRETLDTVLHGVPDRLSADLAAITGSFGALHDEELALDRGADGARGAYLDRIWTC